MLVVSAFFLMREAEMAAETDHVHAEVDQQMVALTPSVPKTDVTAFGVQMEWDCTCFEEQSNPCAC